MHVKKQHLELDMEQQTGFKLEKKYIKAVYCRPAYLGNGTPLQCSCLENPMDGGPWWAAVHGIAKSQT